MELLFENIKYLCNQYGFSIKDLEARVGFSNGQIGKWRTNNPSVYKVKIVADFFGVTIDSLISGKGYNEFSDKDVYTFDLRYIQEFSNLSEKEKLVLKAELIEYLKYQVYKMRNK